MPDITIGRLRGGLCAIWRDADGTRHRHQLKARNRKEAEAEARDLYIRRTAPEGVLVIADIWERYLSYLGDRPTAKTMSYTGKAVLAHFGDLRPDQVADADCTAYTAARAQKGIKVGSIHTELGHLRSALVWAQKRGLIPLAPHIPKPPKPDSDVRPLSHEEIRRLADACIAPHVRLAVILLLATGARVSAVLDLEWNRVDFDRGVIDLRLPDGVTRKGRAVVPMNRMARAALNTAYNAALSDWVVEYAGGRIKSIRTGYSAARRRAGLEGVTIHQIRHTVAVNMLSAGRPIEEVSQFLGHSNIQITRKVYARFMPDHLADAASILEFIEPAKLRN